MVSDQIGHQIRNENVVAQTFTCIFLQSCRSSHLFIQHDSAQNGKVQREGRI